MPLLDLKISKVINTLLRKGCNHIRIRKNIHLTGYSSKIIELGNKTELFFGEMSFDIDDLMRIEEWQRYVNIYALTDIQDKPKLFSILVLSLLKSTNKCPKRRC
jgi:hypothetical protein